MATAAFEEIAETFEFLDDWEDRYRHVIELGRAMPPLDDSFRVPALKVDGKFVPNPLVETQRYLDEFGRIVHGEPLTGEALKKGKETMARGEVDLSQLELSDQRKYGSTMLCFYEARPPGPQSVTATPGRAVSSGSQPSADPRSPQSDCSAARPAT